MKALVLLEAHRFEIQEREIPSPGFDEALIRVRVAGICGTDLHAYHGRQPFLSYPRVLGHEVMGEIAALGPTLSGGSPLSPGDRVCVDLVINCGECYPCRVGRPNCCVNIRVMGVHVDGGFAEYIVAPLSRLHRVPSTIDDETAAMVEPLTIGCQAVARGEVAEGESVAVIGAGPIGIASLMVAKARGARVLMADILDRRLDLALALGADAVVNSGRDALANAVISFTNGEGANVVIEAVGLVPTVEAAIDAASAAGRVVLLGLSSTPVPISPAALIRKELDIRASRMSSRRFPEAIDLIRRHSLPLRQLVSHRVPLSETAEAFQLMAEQPESVCKVLVSP